MTRRQKQPLRLLSAEEQQELERIATRESATRVARAKALLAVAFHGGRSSQWTTFRRCSRSGCGPIQ